MIAKATSTNPRAPLSQLLTAPLGLDVWEVKTDHLVLQATEAQAERLRPWSNAVHIRHSTGNHPTKLDEPLLTPLAHPPLAR